MGPQQRCSSYQTANHVAVQKLRPVLVYLLVYVRDASELHETTFLLCSPTDVAPLDPRQVVSEIGPWPLIPLRSLYTQQLTPAKR